MTQKNGMTQVKKLCLSGVCVALCVVLPLLFHAAGLGAAFSPMHFPVLLCGLACGWGYGGACGLLGPVLASLINQKPPLPALIHLVPELVVYGVAAGLLMRYIRTGRTVADLYLSIVPAMVLGRLVGGAVEAVVYLASAQEFSVLSIATAYFVVTLPGAVCHLVLIPPLVLVLMKAGLLPERYPQKEEDPLGG